ncbi:crotonobetainyl-CoA:carnitine CoA-transferase CaiB-like acyl-CoA transferase [Jezberella montanilacus]|jgi:crotonobetainyl-CoA:carnitine CoA-transferase CaiB-like acyl-CoA transferase|uniref:Crotonobetainyl-CoA:carnitine CoA-transferase CaiB-like acyl-CoA transferase n=2 Tax=Jezberella montanilacus TaxID=323426 RepID=A0A2T0XRG2_9BURK|nr:crotonobetainyl-CoA:carnitine CoA-transferase CaiB-like acyl-CoA transferase [Jezberella montanilacus]
MTAPLRIQDWWNGWRGRFKNMWQNNQTQGALAGCRVVDLSRVLGGPFCTQILGDHGADVIKLEPPQGDETRHWGPPFEDGIASYFIGVNRNKTGLTIDLSQQEGQDFVRSLLSDADIMIENFKPGTLEKWGMGYDVLKEQFPGLIHCRISGFGGDGPLGGLPGYDACAQALCGLMSVNGEKDGEPTRVGLPVVDMVTGMNAALAILMAMNERHRSGLGQFLDITLFDSAISLLHPHAANFFGNGTIPGRSGNAHPNISPYETVNTRSGQLFLAVGNDRQFQILLKVINAEELANDVRFTTNQDRLKNRPALHTILEDKLSTHEAAEIAQTLLRAGVPAAPVMNVKEILEHPHTHHRNMVINEGAYRGLGSPIKLSRTPASLRKLPPGFKQT